MSKSIQQSDHEMTQLGLFDDTRPKPIQVAEEHDFPLQRYEPSDDHPEYLYSVQDWLRGVTHSSNVRRLWKDLQDRNRVYASTVHPSDPGNERVYASTVKLPYQTKGGQQESDFVNAVDLYQITQDLRELKTRKTLKAALDKILKFLATAGAWVDFEKANPAAAMEFHASRAAQQRQHEIEKLTKAGYGEHPAVQHLQLRHDTVISFTLLKRRIAEVCTDPTPQYGRHINMEYLGLFGHVADELYTLLKTKSIRDSLSDLQLTYLQTAEISLRQVLKNQRLDNDQIAKLAFDICQRLGENLAEICAMSGVDVVTGLPLLGDQS